MTENKVPICQKHNMQIIFICSLQPCKDRLICQLCRQKQTLHISSHSNYIYRLKQIKQFQNTNKTIPKLQSGINQCQNLIIEHKKFYTQQINYIKQDFNSLKKQFNSIAQKYQQIYTQSFQKQILKFDQQINNIRNTLKLYIKQKNQQQSLFRMFFQDNQTNENDQFGIETTIKKNSNAYKVRADIITLKSIMKISKTNPTYYKKTQQDNRLLISIHDELDYFARYLFDKFKKILGVQQGTTNDLKSSIALQSKSLAMSRVSLGNLIDLQNDLKRSQLTISTQKTLQKVQLPQLNPQVAKIRQNLKPLPPKNKINLIYQGPYLYSTGVYYGQFHQKKRQGWGQFIFHDGTIYQGQWDKDNISGYGRLIRNHCFYQGQVKDGRAHGKGVYQDAYRRYDGEWKNDKRNGVGAQQFKKKRKIFTGNFVDDKYFGCGTLITQQYTYQGKFKDGLFHGEGQIRFNNGQVFVGTFCQGEKDSGRHTYPDGTFYNGTYKDNLPNGTGEFFWPDGIKFTGCWKSGLQDGVGVQNHQDGKQLKGVWKAGKWQKWLL